MSFNIAIADRHLPETLRAATVEPMTTYGVSHEFGAMLADAIEIADSCARADIECNCSSLTGDWYDTDDLEDEEDTEAIAQALRYLVARGLVERHPAHVHLVRFPKVTP